MKNTTTKEEASEIIKESIENTEKEAGEYMEEVFKLMGVHESEYPLGMGKTARKFLSMVSLAGKIITPLNVAEQTVRLVKDCRDEYDKCICVDATSTPEPAIKSPSARFIVKKRPYSCLIEYGGKSQFIKSGGSKGFFYIRHLLENAGNRVTCKSITEASAQFFGHYGRRVIGANNLKASLKNAIEYIENPELRDHFNACIEYSPGTKGGARKPYFAYTGNPDIWDL